MTQQYECFVYRYLLEYVPISSSYRHILKYSSITASSENIAERNLLQTLFRDYNTNVRPVRNPSHSVEVAIGAAMKQIVDLVSLWH